MSAEILSFRRPEQSNELPGHWRSFANWCAEHPELLKGGEHFFCTSMAKWAGTPTEKQLWWLDLIRRRYENTSLGRTAARS